jgi:undecaprenyl-diphosphatase
MPNWIVVIILGIVEGVTEFLPVSSTGHLLIAEHWLGSHQSDLFNIVIQIGAVLAVIPLFWKRIEMLMRWRESASRTLNLKILVAFVITCIGGLVLKKLGLRLPDSVQPIAVALIVGGIIFIVVEAVAKGHRRSDFISWPVVIAVAVGQLIAAAFPGSSRSGSTIMLAMILGASRVSATEFSFLVGIPTMLAAGSLEVFDHLRKGETEDWALLALAAVTAAIVSFIAVKWLLRYVQSHTFVSFGIYRIVFGILLLWLLWPKP